MRRSALPLFVLLFLFSPRALTQDASTGAICGTVLDPDGGLVVGATVAIVNVAASQTYGTSTDANGHFSVDLRARASIASSTALGTPASCRAIPASIACILTIPYRSKADATPGSWAATPCSPGPTTSSLRCSAENINFDDLRVDPWTFAPMHAGMKITPLRAYAHQVPRYYIQNFGPAISHPDTDEYAAFLQDTIRVTHRLALSLGVRYDRQTFNTSELVSNPLWPQSGHVPVNDLNFAPRVGLAYSIGSERPLVIRAGYGVFYTRIPQIYLSAVTTDDGVNSLNLILDNMDYYGHQAFPKYPNPLVNRTPEAAYCVPPASLVNRLGTEISAFAPNFGTPRVEQASLNIERELADRIAAGVSYLYVHGENMIRARDVNLPLPADVTYPVYDETGSNFLGSYYDLPSFSTWQLTRSMTCPYPPCINPLVRPIPQLQAINQFESVASSVYNGATLSVRRRITHGLYFRLSYTYGRAVDDGQDALVAGRPAVVQNTYATASERGPSVTDQRNRVAFSWITDPKPFGREHDFLAKLFNDWKFSGVLTYGSVRPIDARVIGDPNQDGNSSNDRLPGYSRNSFIGPDYATADLRLTRRLFLTSRLKLDATAEVFNALNRDNQRVSITDDGFQIAQQEKTIGINTFPAYYQRPSNFLAATSSYSPRQIQLASRVTF